MNDIDEILESREIDTEQPATVPDVLKVFAIISLIGHGFLVLIMLIAMLFFANASDRTISSMMGSQMAGMMAILMIVFLFFIGLSILSIVGAAKIFRGKRIGFILYAIGSGILGLLFLLGAVQQTSNLVLALITFGTIIVFASQLKHLR